MNASSGAHQALISSSSIRERTGWILLILMYTIGSLFRLPVLRHPGSID
jgi:hypothetical protein